MNELIKKTKLADLPALVSIDVPVRTHSSGLSASCDYCPKCGPGTLFLMNKRNNVWRYECTKCKIKGDVLDYMKMITGRSFTEVVNLILQMQPNLNDVKVEDVSKNERRNSMVEVIRRLRHLGHTSVKSVLKHYEKKWGIPEGEIINLALDGVLKMFPDNPKETIARLNLWLGKELMIKSGLLKIGNKAPAAAFRQVVLFSKDCCAMELISMNPKAPPLIYGELTSPIVIAKRETHPEVLLVNNGEDGLIAYGSGYKGTIWDTPNDNWNRQWFWDYHKEHHNVCFNLSKLPQSVAAELAADLQERGIAFV